HRRRDVSGESPVLDLEPGGDDVLDTELTCERQRRVGRRTGDYGDDVTGRPVSFDRAATRGRHVREHVVEEELLTRLLEPCLFLAAKRSQRLLGDALG